MTCLLAVEGCPREISAKTGKGSVSILRLSVGVAPCKSSDFTPFVDDPGPVDANVYIA